MECIEQHRCFDGWQQRFKHYSEEMQCDMTFSVYLPPTLTPQAPLPSLLFLSGLTCNDLNFMQKSGAQRYATDYGMALICPDTSPRGEHVPDDPDGAWDFGSGAGFYLDATQAPWDKNYRMYSYLVNELIPLIKSSFSMGQGMAVSGHSMGGHGALVLAMRHPELFTSVSAFAPIASASTCPWGQKALSRYLGDDTEQWKQWDGVELIRQAKQRLPLLVHQGLSDEFYHEQLNTEALVDACAETDYMADIKIIDGYDHSYYFISSFIGEHMAFHRQYLIGAPENLSD